MKIFISFCLLFISLVNGQLRCFYCENQPSLQDCLRNGRIDVCRPNEDACETEVRRRNSNALYFKRCKQRLACMNNEIQNLRAAATPTQCNVFGEGSVCRCCCFSSECGRRENCTDTTPFENPLPTVEPIPSERTPEERCPELPEWDEGEVVCPSVANGKGWKIGEKCEYRCPEGRVVIGESSTVCTRRLNEENGQSELGFFPRPPCCGASSGCTVSSKADIVFVLDSSTSIGAKNWTKIIDFVIRISRTLVVSPTGVQLGVITYGRYVYENWIIPLNYYKSNGEFENAARTTPYLEFEPGTATATALKYTAEHAFNQAFGAREKESLVIFVTDGMTTLDERSELPNAALELKNVVTRVYAVGIGIKDRTELDIIASSPSDVTIIGFDELSGVDILNQIRGFVCDFRCSPPPNNPEERCRLPPIWEEGDVLCPAQTGNGWLIGDVCQYRCLPGYELKGNEFTTCRQVTNPLTGQTEFQFSPEDTPCCDTPCSSIIVADIVFVLDSSTSITAPNWDKIISFVKNLASMVPVSSTRVQFGVITYGYKVYTQDVIRLDNSMNYEEFEERVSKLQYRNERYGTATASALYYTAENAFKPDFGARSNVENKLVIFVTDGRTSPAEREYLPNAIEYLKDIATKVYAVGIGVQDPVELYEIASSDTQVSEINGFNELTGGTLLESIMNFVCNSRCDR